MKLSRWTQLSCSKSFCLGSGIMGIKRQFPPPPPPISLTKLWESLFPFFITLSFFSRTFPPFQHPLFMLLTVTGVPTLFRPRSVVLCSWEIPGKLVKTQAGKPHHLCFSLNKCGGVWPQNQHAQPHPSHPSRLRWFWHRWRAGKTPAPPEQHGWHALLRRELGGDLTPTSCLSSDLFGPSLCSGSSSWTQEEPRVSVSVHCPCSTPVLIGVIGSTYTSKTEMFISSLDLASKLQTDMPT